jgi:amino acid adenylation domain-containing protein
VRLEGALDLEALECAINEIVRRHEVLRTRFEVEAGAPVQVIDEWKHRSLEVEYLMDWPQDERAEEAERIAREEAETGFNLSSGPLIRVRVLKLEEEQHVLLYTMHHIVSDAWSMGVLVREVCALYEAISGGQGSPLPELEIQYSDYAVWQREYFAGGGLEGEVKYWKKQLEDAAIMDLPTDHARPAARSYQGGSERVEIGKALNDGLRRLSQQEGATLFMLLMAAFKVVLMRWSGEEDISVGTVIANRNRKEVEGLIGFFVNTLVMRTDLSGNPSFRDLINREREVAFGAYAHQDMPFEKLVEEINPERDLRRNPLVDVMMALQNTKREELRIGRLKVCGIGEEKGVAKFDLTLMLTEGGEGITGGLNYSKDLFEGETIKRMARHYERVVQEVVKVAERRIREIELMSPEEKKQVIVEFNRTERDYQKEQCIHELFEAQAARTPEQIALIGAGQSLSYGELNRRANQLAAYLRSLGVGPEVVVGLCLERSFEMVWAVMGVLKAGGAYLPLDPEHPMERLQYILEDAEVGVALTRKALEERLPAYGGETRSLDVEWERISEQSEQEPESEVRAGNLAYVIYTSGSTGEPKGVAVHHQALVARVAGMIETFEMTSADRLMGFVSTSFDAFGEEIFPTLNSGASLVIDRQAASSSANDVLDMVEQLAITTLHSTVAYWHQLVNEIYSSRRQVSGPFRLYIAGGESPSVEALKKWSVLAPYQSRFVNAYGPTEATITAMFYGIQMDSSQIYLQTRMPIGEPIANTQVYILDQHQEVAPVGVKGELYIGGAGVTRGYLGRAEMTAEKFVPHLFSEEDGARLYRTGDMCRYLEDGKIEFLERVDGQVKVRGYRIELSEIEAALNEHSSVRQSVVIAREDESGGKRLLGYVVGEEDVTAAELKTYLNGRLPGHMVPEAILMLEEMPVTANGKIDRKSLPRAEAADMQVVGEYFGPRTPVEEILVGIYEEVLKLDRVGIHDNFFEIGGHSLLAIKVGSRMKNIFGIEIAVMSIFEAPTVSKLAETLIAQEPKPGQTEEIALIHKRLSSMTDEDAGEELAARGAIGSEREN